MNRIRLLPEQVANQIAAGEVVERPASVVKELVENSLDADSRRITVEIQAGGRSLIRVTDDGWGMSRDDALLCLERHATSKIKRAEDLAAISTMGFRGEALPSIASVSRFILTTRERDGDSPEGTRIIITGGKIMEVKSAGAAPGTSIEARQLFFNLPARRKFLRSEETESAHIQHYLALAALAHPGVAFTFQKDGRVVWQLPAVKRGPDPASRLEALHERLRALYGSDQKLLSVDFTGPLPGWREPEENGAAGSQSGEAERSGESTIPAGDKKVRAPEFQVWGFIGAPGVSRATREDQHLFVNRRPVDNRGLNFALLEGYHTSLMKGRYPVCCLFLEIDPAAVDVNIHPAKREVKFHREWEVRALVAQAVRETLLRFHGVDSVTGRSASPESALPAKVESEDSGGTTGIQHGLPNFPAPLQPPVTTTSGHAAQPALRMGFGPAVQGKPETVQTNSEEATSSISSTESPPRFDVPEAPGPAMPLPGSPAPASRPVPLLNVPLRLVGVIGKLYVLLESDRGLVLLDQHAAHERILFEQMLNRLEHGGQAPSQKLLLPETVELSARDSQFIREQLSELARLGVGLSEFGERTFLLDALPPFVKVKNPRLFVLELVDQLKAAGQEVNSLRLGEHMVAKTVCRHAVKANDPLAGQELEALIEDLRQCSMPYTCPHGRPTLLEMNFRELEKKFGRSQ
jgi:DNA mismatch repair protein MutL